jgi:hypothetical protein
MVTTGRKTTSIVPSDRAKQRASFLGSIVSELTKLAAMLGEPLDEKGLRLALMADQLSDLSEEAVIFSIKAWGRGDSSHLSAYAADHTRIGVFFPKPAELREIARLYMRAERDKQEERERWEASLADSVDRVAHPENYCSMGDVLKDVAERGRVKLLEAAKLQAEKPAACSACAGRVLSALSAADLRALADLKEAAEANGRKEA